MILIQYHKYRNQQSFQQNSHMVEHQKLQQNLEMADNEVETAPSKNTIIITGTNVADLIIYNADDVVIMVIIRGNAHPIGSNEERPYCSLCGRHNHMVHDCFVAPRIWTPLFYLFMGKDG